MPSHNFGTIICSGNSKVTNGNKVNYVTNSHGGVGRTGITQPVGNRHVYKRVIAGDNAIVHNGNIGVSVGHEWGIIEARDCATVDNGDHIDVVITKAGTS